MVKLAFVTSVLMLAAAPVIAQTPTDQTTTESARKDDPDRIICQKEEQIGTRLAPKKVCLTARQWKERVHLMREETERAQQSAGLTRSN